MDHWFCRFHFQKFVSPRNELISRLGDIFRRYTIRYVNFLTIVVVDLAAVEYGD